MSPEHSSRLEQTHSNGHFHGHFTPFPHFLFSPPIIQMSRKSGVNTNLKVVDIGASFEKASADFRGKLPPNSFPSSPTPSTPIHMRRKSSLANIGSDIMNRPTFPSTLVSSAASSGSMSSVKSPSAINQLSSLTSISDALSVSSFSSSSKLNQTHHSSELSSLPSFPHLIKSSANSLSSSSGSTIPSLACIATSPTTSSVVSSSPPSTTSTVPTLASHRPRPHSSSEISREGYECNEKLSSSANALPVSLTSDSVFSPSPRPVPSSSSISHRASSSTRSIYNNAAEFSRPSSRDLRPSSSSKLSKSLLEAELLIPTNDDISDVMKLNTISLSELYPDGLDDDNQILNVPSSDMSLNLASCLRRIDELHRELKPSLSSHSRLSHVPDSDFFGELNLHRAMLNELSTSSSANSKPSWMIHSKSSSAVPSVASSLTSPSSAVSTFSPSQDFDSYSSNFDPHTLAISNRIQQLERCKQYLIDGCRQYLNWSKLRESPDQKGKSSISSVAAAVPQLLDAPPINRTRSLSDSLSSPVSTLNSRPDSASPSSLDSIPSTSDDDFIRRRQAQQKILAQEKREQNKIEILKFHQEKKRVCQRMKLREQARQAEIDRRRQDPNFVTSNLQQVKLELQSSAKDEDEALANQLKALSVFTSHDLSQILPPKSNSDSMKSSEDQNRKSVEANFMLRRMIGEVPKESGFTPLQVDAYLAMKFSSTKISEQSAIQDLPWSDGRPVSDVDRVLFDESSSKQAVAHQTSSNDHSISSESLSKSHPQSADISSSSPAQLPNFEFSSAHSSSIAHVNSDVTSISSDKPPHQSHLSLHFPSENMLKLNHSANPDLSPLDASSSASIENQSRAPTSRLMLHSSILSNFWVANLQSIKHRVHQQHQAFKLSSRRSQSRPLTARTSVHSNSKPSPFSKSADFSNLVEQLEINQISTSDPDVNSLVPPADVACLFYDDNGGEDDSSLDSNSEAETDDDSNASSPSAASNSHSTSAQKSARTEARIQIDDCFQRLAAASLQSQLLQGAQQVDWFQHHLELPPSESVKLSELIVSPKSHSQKLFSISLKRSNSLPTESSNSGSSSEHLDKPPSLHRRRSSITELALNLTRLASLPNDVASANQSSERHQIEISNRSSDMSDSSSPSPMLFSSSPSDSLRSSSSSAIEQTLNHIRSATERQLSATHRFQNEIVSLDEWPVMPFFTAPSVNPPSDDADVNMLGFDASSRLASARSDAFELPNKSEMFDQVQPAAYESFAQAFSPSISLHPTIHSSDVPLSGKSVLTHLDPQFDSAPPSIQPSPVNLFGVKKSFFQATIKINGAKLSASKPGSRVNSRPSSAKINQEFRDVASAHPHRTQVQHQAVCVLKPSALPLSSNLTSALSRIPGLASKNPNQTLPSAGSGFGGGFGGRFLSTDLLNAFRVGLELADQALIEQQQQQQSSAALSTAPSVEQSSRAAALLLTQTQSSKPSKSRPSSAVRFAISASEASQFVGNQPQKISSTSNHGPVDDDDDGIVMVDSKFMGLDSRENSRPQSRVNHTPRSHAVLIDALESIILDSDADQILDDDEAFTVKFATEIVEQELESMEAGNEIIHEVLVVEEFDDDGELDTSSRQALSSQPQTAKPQSRPNSAPRRFHLRCISDSFELNLRASSAIASSTSHGQPNSCGATSMTEFSDQKMKALEDYEMHFSSPPRANPRSHLMQTSSSSTKLSPVFQRPASSGVFDKSTQNPLPNLFSPQHQKRASTANATPTSPLPEDIESETLHPIVPGPRQRPIVTNSVAKAVSPSDMAPELNSSFLVRNRSHVGSKGRRSFVASGLYEELKLNDRLIPKPPSNNISQSSRPNVELSQLASRVVENISELEENVPNSPWSGFPQPSLSKNSPFPQSSARSNVQPVAGGILAKLQNRPPSGQPVGFHRRVQQPSNLPGSEQPMLNSIHHESHTPRRRGDLLDGLQRPESAFSQSLRFAVDEINRVQQDGQITIMKLLGTGAFGRVYLGRVEGGLTSLSSSNKHHHDLVAIKRLIMDGSHESLLKLLAAEVSMLRSLSHENIVSFLGLFRTSNGRDPHTYNILLEYVEGGSLMHLLQAYGGRFDESYAAGLLIQLLHGLNYLHSQNVIHRDLKLANILVTKTEPIVLNAHSRGIGIFQRTMPIVKISDFGTAVRVCEAQAMRRSCVGTPWFLAPEVIQVEEYSFPADIWSIGCCLFNMVTGKRPYHELNAMQCIYRMVIDDHPPIPHEFQISDECRDFIMCCWKRNWRDRPTAQQLMTHPFIVKNVASGSSLD